MKKQLLTHALLLLSFLLTAQQSAFEVNEKLGRGVNFGNCFESPRNNSWGNEIKEEYPGLIAEFGFDAVRIPVRWSDWASETPPYTIEQQFIDSVRRVVDWSLDNGLMVVLNVHHFEEIFEDPDAYEEMLIHLWGQITLEFQDYPDSLLFEILNEPHANLDAEKWNAMFPKVIDTVRYYNPTRKLVIGPPDWNNVGSVDKLTWPENDTNLILTVHYYNPFQFTHQGAGWVDNSDGWLGTTWDSTAAERNAIYNDFSKVRTFSETHNVPVYVGEFGSYSTADAASRRKWTATCARIFEDMGFSWGYWEFMAGFGVYDPGNEIWRNDLLNALTGQIDPLSVPPEPWEASNADFSNELTGWSFQLTGDQVTAVASADTGVAVFEISQTDGTSWHVQFFQTGLEMIKGAEYRVSFDAWSEAPGASLFSYMGRSSSPWDFYWDGLSASLTSDRQTFSADFIMEKDTDPNARVVFNLGFSPSVIFLDDIEIEKLSDPEPEPEPEPEPVLVTNIQIDQGSGFIDSYQGTLQLTSVVFPSHADNDTVDWSVASGGELATIDESGLLQASGGQDGTVVVRATATDGSGVFDEVTIVVTNQTTGMNQTVQKTLHAWLDHENLIFEVPYSTQHGELTLFSITGKKVHVRQIAPRESTGTINMGPFAKGIYFLQYTGYAGRRYVKLMYSEQ